VSQQGGADLRFLNPKLNTSFTLQDHGYGASASRGVPVYVPAFAGTHCAYPRRDGQAELTWVGGCIQYQESLTAIPVLTGPDDD